MDPLDLARNNLLSPMVLSFGLGVSARLVRSDLALPPAIVDGLSLYLLFAIGLKGGVALSNTSAGAIALPALATLILGIVIALWCYGIVRRVLRLDTANASSIAAHYGSTSAVTYLAAVAFLDAAKTPNEGFMPALLALMEIPAIVVALLLARDAGGEGRAAALRHVLTGRSIILLAGGLVIGAAAGATGVEKVTPFFVVPFSGVLCLFLLDLGMTAADRLRELRGQGLRLVGFGLVMPLIHGPIGVGAGWLCGLSAGGATLLGVLAAGASYIAAPAAVRLALPKANLAYALAPALGVTFPLNLVIGIPLYHALAQRLCTCSASP